MSDIRNYLEMTVTLRGNMKRPKDLAYSCIEDFVLRNGRQWTPAALPPKLQPGKRRECFKNAFDLAMSVTGLRYVEGYACGVIPVLHAWCADADGMVVDTTWTGGRFRSPLGMEYFGVAFGTEFLFKALAKKKTYGLIDDWEGGWPLLTGKDADFNPVP